jgi:hypothetical protein
LKAKNPPLIQRSLVPSGPNVLDEAVSTERDGMKTLTRTDAEEAGNLVLPSELAQVRPEGEI